VAPSPISCANQLPSAVVPPPASLLLLPSAVVPLLLFRCGVSIEDAAAACCCVLLWLPRFAASSSPVGCRKKNAKVYDYKKSLGRIFGAATTPGRYYIPWFYGCRNSRYFALLTGRKIAKIREVFADPLLLNKCARSSSRGSHKGAPTRAKH